MTAEEAQELVDLIDYCLTHKYIEAQDHWTEKVVDARERSLARIAELLTP